MTEITAENYKKIAKNKSRRFPNYQKFSIPTNIEEIETISIKEAAKLLDLTEKTIFYHIKRRHLQAFRSTRWIISKKSVNAFKQILDINR